MTPSLISPSRGGERRWEMQCVILAAGKGTRMGELTKNTPKPLLDVRGKSILEWDLDALPDEIDEVILVVGYLGEKIREKFGQSYKKPLTFNSSPLKRGEEGLGADTSSSMGEGGGRVIRIRYIEQKELKGTADALWSCKDILKGRFLVFYGDDVYSKADLAKLVKEPLAVLSWEAQTKDVSLKGPAIIRVDEEGYLFEILERQPIKKGGLINTGAYVLDTKIFNYNMASAGSPPTEFGLPQTFVQMIKDGAKFKVIQASYWQRISEPEDLQDLSRSTSPAPLGHPPLGRGGGKGGNENNH